MLVKLRNIESDFIFLGQRHGTRYRLLISPREDVISVRWGVCEVMWTSTVYKVVTDQ